MSNLHIDEIGGASPVQAYGTIDDAYRLYFCGRGGRWQFVAGPAEIETDNLVEQVLLVQGYDQGVERDERVFVLQGDDAQEGYLSDEGGTYSAARGMIDVCVQQFNAWIRSQGGALYTGKQICVECQEKLPMTSFSWRLKGKLRQYKCRKCIDDKRRKRKEARDKAPSWGGLRSATFSQ